MFINTRNKVLATAVASAAIVAGAVVVTGATASKTPPLTAQQICDAKAILVPCEDIDSLEPERRAALEEDARSVLKGRTPQEAESETQASLKELRKESPIKLVGDRETDHGVIEGNEISNDLKLTIPGFSQANMWTAPYRLVGGDQNSVIVYVGSSPDDPAQGLLVREAAGDTVPAPNGGALTPVPLPVGHGPGAHITDADKDGVLTIGFSDGSTIQYDAINAKVL
jgi:hypothetical protein